MRTLTAEGRVGGTSPPDACARCLAPLSALAAAGRSATAPTASAAGSTALRDRMSEVLTWGVCGCAKHARSAKRPIRVGSRALGTARFPGLPAPSGGRPVGPTVRAMARRSMRWLGSAIALALLSAVAAGGGAAAGQAPGPEAVQLLPDLDQQTPNGLTIARSGGKWPQYSLGFQSAVRNVGGGPLLITGRRASAKTPTMHAQQLIQRTDGTQDAVRTPDRLRYAVSPTHRHWHLLRFDRYMLRRAGRRNVLVRDQKTGFCLGDRYRVVSVAVPAAPPAPVYTGGCAMRQPDRLSVTEGISPGYGDNYLPHLEGQSLLLSGLPAGRYVLIHRANTDHALREVSYANNSASLLIELRWRGGAPSVNVL